MVVVVFGPSLSEMYDSFCAKSGMALKSKCFPFNLCSNWLPDSANTKRDFGNATLP